jgi:hypothetical protein
LLRASTAALHNEVEALDAAALAWRPAPEEWCVNEVMGHLLEAERRGFAGRIRQILDADGPTFATWDPPEVAIARRDHERNGHDLFAELAALRARSLALVERLTTADLSRSGIHPQVGELRVQELLHEWVFHDRAHMQQIYDVVKQMMWPHMGNARRFSQPDAE